MTRCLSTIWILYNSRHIEEFCGFKTAKPQPIFFLRFSKPHQKKGPTFCSFGTAFQNRMRKHLRFRNRISKPHAKAIAISEPHAKKFAVLDAVPITTYEPYPNRGLSDIELLGTVLDDLCVETTCLVGVGV